MSAFGVNLASLLERASFSDLIQVDAVKCVLLRSTGLRRTVALSQNEHAWASSQSGNSSTGRLGSSV